MALTAAQQAEFDKVKNKVNSLVDLMQESLNLQANGGYHVLNELRDLGRQLQRVETAVDPETP